MLYLFLLPALVWGFARTYNPLPEYQFSWTADTITNKLSVQVVVTPGVGEVVGWVGFGIAGGAGGMLGGDMFTAYATGAATCAIQDRQADLKALPKEDTSDPDGFADWTVDSCSETGGVFTIAATRAFVTYDVHDLDFVTGPMNLMFVWGKTKPSSPASITFHDGGHVPRAVSLWGEAIVEFDTSTFGDYDTQEITMANVSIGNQTSYTCRGFNITQKDDNATHAIAFEALIDPVNEPFVHHIVVYACRFPVSTEPFDCVSMPSSCSSGIIYAWGKGGNPFVLPTETGLEIGTTGRTYVALQMHYNNVNDVQDLIDNSGVVIYRTNQLRPTQTGMVFMGTIQLNLTYGQSVVGVSGKCNASASSGWPATGLNVYSSFLHAHQRGRRLWTNVFRNGSLIGTMGNNQAYDFNLQKVVALVPTVTIFPGDEFITYCTYDTSNDVSNVMFGETTAHEMCINFLAYYPAFSTNPTMSCGLNANPYGASKPGPQSCVLLPSDPPAAYVVTDWAVSDSYYLTAGNATCAPGFTGTAVLGCTGYGAPFTFAGCRRQVVTSAPTSAPSTAPSSTTSTAPSTTSAPSSGVTSAPSSTATTTAPTPEPGSAVTSAPTAALVNSAVLPVVSAATLISLLFLA